MKPTGFLLLIASFVFMIASADQIDLEDGSLLKGKITRISEGKIYMQTTYAGEIVVSQESALRLETDQPIPVKLTDGSRAKVKLGSETIKQIQVTQIVMAGDAAEPAEVQPESKSIASQEKPEKWKWEGAFGISAASGNSQKGDFSGSIKGSKETKDYRIEGSLRYQMSESKYKDGSSRKTADEWVATTDYASFFMPHVGWYIKQALERDRFENLKLRSLSSFGLAWKIITADTYRLEVASGLGNRYETYGFDLDGDGIDDRSGSQNLLGMDLGMKFYWKINDWIEWNTSLGINPAFEDMSDYRIDHTSTIDVPLGKSDLWKLRLAFTNQYNSKAAENIENMDTTYTLSLLFKW